MRFHAALAALFLISSCELPMSAEFNNPLDAKAPSGTSTKVLREFGFAPGPGSGTNPAGSVAGIINEAAGTVAVTVPSGTDLRSLVASFLYAGASIKVGGVAQTSGTSKIDFSSAVIYTVTATDGTAKNYTVSVTVGSASGGTPAPTGVGATPGNQLATITWSTVSEANTYNVYWSTNPGVTILNGNKAPGVVSPYQQTSLTNGVTYYFLVTAVSSAGESPASTMVNATPGAALSSSKDITTFSFSNSTNTVISAAGGTTGTIDVTVPAGTDVTSLAPNLTHSGSSISPAGGTPRNFSTPQTYTVTAADNTTKTYTVTVTRALGLTVTISSTLTVTLSESSTVSWTLASNATRVVTIVAPTSPDVVGWYLDGTLISGSAGQKGVTVNQGAYATSPGSHSLMAVVTNGNTWSSATTYFKVN